MLGKSLKGLREQTGAGDPPGDPAMSPLYFFSLSQEDKDKHKIKGSYSSEGRHQSGFRFWLPRVGRYSTPYGITYNRG